MKKIQVMIVPILLSMVIACASTPYTKDKLPGGIEYYPSEKQFEVTPSWYWRIRPNTEPVTYAGAVIGHQYLPGKSGKGIVVGEYTKDEKFYVAKWKEYGYFFIKQKDYQFAKKYKKYSIPLKYEDENLYKNPVAPLKLGDDQFNYKLNLMSRLKDYFEKRGYILVSTIGITKTGMIHQEEYMTDTTRQIIRNRQYINQFLIIPKCSKYYEFCNKSDVSAYGSKFASTYLKNTQYETKLGAVYNGQVYVAEYIIGQWGEVFYSFPTM